jgi:hypothetical protein
MLNAFWKNNKQYLLLAIIVIFHTVGFFGLQSASRAYFLSLSPLNLMLSFTCLLLSYIPIITSDFSSWNYWIHSRINRCPYTITFW